MTIGYEHRTAFCSPSPILATCLYKYNSFELDVKQLYAIMSLRLYSFGRYILISINLMLDQRKDGLKGSLQNLVRSRVETWNIEI